MVFLFVFILFFLVGCKDPVTLVSIEADLTTISDPYDLEEFDLTKIKIILKKSDGSKDSISLTEEMLSSTDLFLLQSAGEHEVTVKYKGLETKITIKLEENIVKQKLKQIYQQLVNFNSYQASYEDWIASLNLASGLKIVDANINENREIIISLSDGSKVSGGILKTIDAAGEVYVFTINDTHGAFLTDEYPGLEKVSSVIKSLEISYGKHIKIANGDIFQGGYESNINYGLPILDALNLMEFDALVIGNHEFDWGLDKIAAYADGNPNNGEADFPFLAANIVYKDTGKRLPWTDDYVIVENNGYKVGIIGVIGERLTSSISYEMVKDYEFLNPYPIIQKHSKSLRAEHGCNLVLVATHNFHADEINSYLALPYESRIDGIITAHTHQLINDSIPREDGYELPIIQCDDKNETVGQLIIKIDEDKNPKTATIKHYRPENYANNHAFLELVTKYSEAIDEGNRVVGYTTETLYEFRLGREMANAMKEKYSADVAFINTGGVRAVINVGNIRIRDVYEVFPFDNKIVLTSIRGDKLKSLYEDQKNYLYFDSDFKPYTISDLKYYEIATIDFVYTSAYYQDYFSGSSREDREYMRDIFIEYLENFYNDLK